MEETKHAPTTGTCAATAGPDTRKPTDRAFVVQLAPDCEPDAEHLAGRVQHLATADGGNFGSVEGLLAIMRRVLDRAAGRDAE